MAIEVIMPRLSDTMEEGKVLKWLRQVGEVVKIGEVIAEVETDKADMELEVFDEGVLAEIRVQEGESAPVGAVMAILAEVGEQVVPALGDAETRRHGDAETIAASPTRPVAASQLPPPDLRPPKPETRARREEQRKEAAPQSRVFASPLVKRMAEEKRIDLAQLRGSGPGGRVVRSDLEAYLTPARPQVAPQPQRELQEATPVPAPISGKREALSRMRATIAKRMAESKREIPHFYVTAEIDMSEAVRLKEALAASDRVEAKVTHTHVIAKAVAVALERHPYLNASFVEEAREVKGEVNLGIAVALEDGLIVPVLKGCGGLSLLQIAEKANELVERIRGGKPRVEDLSEGTFTISNMGMLPIEHFAAVINPPQGAILAVGAIKERPVVRDGHVVAARTMMVTLSCDHRIIDGVLAGQFLAELKKLLENPVSLMV
jgi:pyruvate dehydrogenase E2 component (dihydrolipoamide acetyltransferase)